MDSIVRPFSGNNDDGDNDNGEDSNHDKDYNDDDEDRLEICQKIYTSEDFRVKNLHRKRVIFDIC